MDEQSYTYYQTYQQPAESASGTTSSENKSGPFAYIITIVCVLALIGISTACTRCTSGVMSKVIDKLVYEGWDNYEYFVDNPEDFERIINDDGFDADTFDEYFEQIFGDTYDDYFNIPKGNDNVFENQGDTYEFNSRDVIGLDIAIYEYTIDSMVSASVYAGSDADVKDFVRDFVLRDRNAADDLVHEFRAAGRSGEDFTEHLENAREIAVSTLDELASSELPNTNDETQLALGEAIEHATGRWSAIVEFIDLLMDNETVSDQELESVDDTIYYETRNAAQAFEDALAASKN